MKSYVHVNTVNARGGGVGSPMRRRRASPPASHSEAVKKGADVAAVRAATPFDSALPRLCGRSSCRATRLRILRQTSTASSGGSMANPQQSRPRHRCERWSLPIAKLPAAVRVAGR